MSADTRPLAIFLMGPTASGKTALAQELFDRFEIGLISVDSALVYRGLDIGSAKPDAATLVRYPHALIDIRDPADAYSAAEFRDDALQAMDTIAADARTPVLVGGTGLYFRALQYGLSTLPEADAATRSALSAEAAKSGWAALHARLAVLDPVAAARIGDADSQRIQRALEVIALTGMPLSAQQGSTRGPFRYRVLKIAMMPTERTQLHERIARRLEEMFAQGLIGEVAALRAKAGVDEELPSMRAVGYRQVWQHLDGRFDLAEAHRRALYATRQLAKRQTTWLRGDLDAFRIDPFAAAALTRVQRLVAGFLPNPRHGRVSADIRV